MSALLRLQVDYWLGELTGELHRRYQKQAPRLLEPLSLWWIRVSKSVVHAGFTCVCVCSSFFCKQGKVFCQLH